MVTISSLPYDILEDIIHYACTGPTRSSPPLKDILLISRTCSAFHRAAERFIYRRLVIEAPDNLVDFLLSLEERPYLNDYVLELDILTVRDGKESCKADAEKLKRLIALLARCGLSFESYDNSVRGNPWNIECTTLAGLHMLPELQKISIGRPFSTTLSSAFKDVPSWEIVTSFTLSYGSLEHPLSINETLEALLLFPSLESLEVHYLDTADFDLGKVSISLKSLCQRFNIRISKDEALTKCRNIVFKDSYLTPKALLFFIRFLRPKKLWYSEHRKLGPIIRQRKHYRAVFKALSAAKPYLEDLAYRGGFTDSEFTVFLLEFHVLKYLCIDAAKLDDGADAARAANDVDLTSRRLKTPVLTWVGLPQSVERIVLLFNWRVTAANNSFILPILSEKRSGRAFSGLKEVYTNLNMAHGDSQMLETEAAQAKVTLGSMKEARKLGYVIGVADRESPCNCIEPDCMGHCTEEFQSQPLF